MHKLSQPREGEYFLDNIPVSPVLVYGPIMYTYDYTDCNNIELPVDSLVEQIRAETGFDLEKKANSYHSGGIGVKHDGTNTRHEIVMFFKSVVKPLN